ncbi:MAG: hypothetical protein ACO3E1_03590 [Flavobacteriales bacterium]
MKKALLISMLVAFTALFNNDSFAQCTKGNCFTGSGTFKFPNGDQYDGQWLNGKPHGPGTYLFVSGDKYIGSFFQGKRSGFGTYIWIKGGKYAGNWKDDKRDGYGKFYWLGTAQYSGTWAADQIVTMDVNTTTDTQAKPVEGN